MTSSSTPHPFEKIKGYYDQNPSKAHTAAGFAAVTTGATSMAAWIGGRPMPKIAKITVLGLTFTFNIAAMNMRDASVKELAKVALIGKNIIDDTVAAAKNALGEWYANATKEDQSKATENPTKINLNLKMPVTKVEAASAPIPVDEKTINEVLIVQTPELEKPAVEILGNDGGEDSAV